MCFIQQSENACLGCIRVHFVTRVAPSQPNARAVNTPYADIDATEQTHLGGRWFEGCAVDAAFLTVNRSVLVQESMDLPTIGRRRLREKQVCRSEKREQGRKKLVIGQIGFVFAVTRGETCVNRDRGYYLRRSVLGRQRQQQQQQDLSFPKCHSLLNYARVRRRFDISKNWFIDKHNASVPK